VDPDPGGPKICGSGGSGSGTLAERVCFSNLLFSESGDPSEMTFSTSALFRFSWYPNLVILLTKVKEGVLKMNLWNSTLLKREVCTKRGYRQRWGGVERRRGEGHGVER
jgi:hypothetical protein